MLGDKSTAPVTASLKHVRAAQLRASAVRWALGKTAFGLVFLIGAMAHAMTPRPLEGTSALATMMLLLLSTLNVGLGMHGFAKVRHRGLRLWLPATILYGLSATVMLRLVAAR
jgi:hypothetical protein